MRHILSTIALAPLLLWQGRRVRAEVPLLPEPVGERHGVTGSGPQLKLLILGDSAAAGVGAATQTDALSGALVQALQAMFEVRWKLVATTGHTTADALTELAAMAIEPFDVVDLYLGHQDDMNNLYVRTTALV